MRGEERRVHYPLEALRVRLGVANRVGPPRFPEDSESALATAPPRPGTRGERRGVASPGGPPRLAGHPAPPVVAERPWAGWPPAAHAAGQAATADGPSRAGWTRRVVLSGGRSPQSEGLSAERRASPAGVPGGVVRVEIPSTGLRACLRLRCAPLRMTRVREAVRSRRAASPAGVAGARRTTPPRLRRLSPSPPEERETSQTASEQRRSGLRDAAPPSSPRPYERAPGPTLPSAHARRAPGPPDSVRLLPRRPAPSATPSPPPAPPATAAGPGGPRRPRRPRVAHAHGAPPVPRDRPLGRAPGRMARSAGRRVRRRAGPRLRPVPPDGTPRPDRPAPRARARRASERRAPRPRPL